MVRWTCFSFFFLFEITPPVTELTDTASVHRTNSVPPKFTPAQCTKPASTLNTRCATPSLHSRCSMQIRANWTYLAKPGYIWNRATIAKPQQLALRTQAPPAPLSRASPCHRQELSTVLLHPDLFQPSWVGTWHVPETTVDGFSFFTQHL
jgi:hypothetical protein